MTTTEKIQKLLNNGRALTKEEETLLFQYYESNRTIELRNQIIMKNLGLVNKISGKYQSYGIDMEELRQEGIFGLAISIDRFDYRKGNKFSTYAFHWISQTIGRYILNTSHTIRLPVHINGKYSKILSIQKEYEQEHGESPDEAYIAKKMHLSVHSVHNILDAASYANPCSLNALIMVEESNNTELIEMIEDASFDGPEECVLRDMENAYLLETMKNLLSEKEERVMEMRFGLNGYHPMTLQEAGECEGVTRERIRQIEKKALKKLRQSPKIKSLKK